MIARDKRWLVAGIGAGALVLAGIYATHRRSGGTAGEDAGGDGDRAEAWRGFAAGSTRGGETAAEGAPAARGPAANPAPPPAVDDVMSSWAQAIQVHDSDTVVSLDHAFAENPGRFGVALVKSARSDGDERVRAFSTRVLGKTRNAGLVDLYTELLDDKSPYVRQNAAWALGELATQPAGRELAQKTLADLRRLESRDGTPDVRAAATSALKRLQ